MAQYLSPADYSDCPIPLKDYLMYMQTIQGRSPKTVAAYHVDLRTFLRFIYCLKNNQRIPEDLSTIDISHCGIELIRQVTLSDVYGFLNYAMTQRANNASTRARKVSSIRSFYRYLLTKTMLIEDNPVKHLEVPTRKKAMPRYLTLEESTELLETADSEDTVRDYCILTLFLNCGMRLSELVGINLPDIRNDTLRLLGKGNKERIIYLNSACLDAISHYFDARKKIIGPDGSAFFVSKSGKRLSARRVEQIVANYLKAAGLSGRGYSPHKLRHTAATLMYQYGEVDVRVLKEILGHADLSTTEIYTHTSDAQLQKAAASSPLSKIKGSKG